MDHLHHVVLIHGTFARDSKWFREGSLLRERISTALGGQVVFHKFPWTGLNWHTARLKAASDLLDYITESFDDATIKNVFLISHSHGGNIVVYANNLSAELLNHIAGAAFLGTPFISYEYAPTTRPNDRVWIKALYWACYVSISALGLGLIAVLGDPKPNLLNLLLLIAAVTSFTIFPDMIARHQYIQLLRSKRRMKQLCEWLIPKKISNPNVLVVTNPLDEVMVYLRAAHLLSAFLRLFRIANYFPLVALAILVLIFSGLFAIFVHPASTATPYWFFLLVFAMGYSIPLLIIWIVLSVAAGKLSSLIFASRFTFGPDLKIDPLQCRMILERLPKELQDVRVVHAPARAGLIGRYHTNYYNEDQVLTALIDVMHNSAKHNLQ